MTWTTPKNLSEAKDMAKIIAASSFVKGVSAHDVLCMVMFGASVGMDAMAAVRAFHVVKGRKPSLSADAIRALAKRHPECISFRLVNESDTHATFETLRRGDDAPTSMSFTMDDAKAANLTKNPLYRTFPRAMLRARCSANLAAQVYPDALFGLANEGAEVEYVAMEPAAPALPPPPPVQLTDDEGIELAQQHAKPGDAMRAMGAWLMDNGHAASLDAAKKIVAATANSLFDRLGDDVSVASVGRAWAQVSRGEAVGVEKNLPLQQESLDDGASAQ